MSLAAAPSPFPDSMSNPGSSLAASCAPAEDPPEDSGGEEDFNTSDESSDDEDDSDTDDKQQELIAQLLQVPNASTSVCRRLHLDYQNKDQRKQYLLIRRHTRSALVKHVKITRPWSDVESVARREKIIKEVAASVKASMDWETSQENMLAIILGLLRNKRRSKLRVRNKKHEEQTGKKPFRGRPIIHGKYSTKLKEQKQAALRSVSCGAGSSRMLPPTVPPSTQLMPPPAQLQRSATEPGTATPDSIVLRKKRRKLKKTRGATPMPGQFDMSTWPPSSGYPHDMHSQPHGFMGRPIGIIQTPGWRMPPVEPPWGSSQQSTQGLPWSIGSQFPMSGSDGMNNLDISQNPFMNSSFLQQALPDLSFGHLAENHALHNRDAGGASQTPNSLDPNVEFWNQDFVARALREANEDSQETLDTQGLLEDARRQQELQARVAAQPTDPRTSTSSDSASAMPPASSDMALTTTPLTSVASSQNPAASARSNAAKKASATRRRKKEVLEKEMADQAEAEKAKAAADARNKIEEEQRAAAERAAAERAAAERAAAERAAAHKAAAEKAAAERAAAEKAAAEKAAADRAAAQKAAVAKVTAQKAATEKAAADKAAAQRAAAEKAAADKAAAQKAASSRANSSRAVSSRATSSRAAAQKAAAQKAAAEKAAADKAAADKAAAEKAARDKAEVEACAAAFEQELIENERFAQQNAEDQALFEEALRIHTEMHSQAGDGESNGTGTATEINARSKTRTTSSTQDSSANGPGGRKLSVKEKRRQAYLKGLETRQRNSVLRSTQHSMRQPSIEASQAPQPAASTCPGPDRGTGPQTENPSNPAATEEQPGRTLRMHGKRSAMKPPDKLPRPRLKVPRYNANTTVTEKAGAESNPPTSILSRPGMPVTYRRDDITDTFSTQSLTQWENANTTQINPPAPSSLSDIDASQGSWVCADTQQVIQRIRNVRNTRTRSRADNADFKIMHKK